MDGKQQPVIAVAGSEAKAPLFLTPARSAAPPPLVTPTPAVSDMKSTPAALITAIARPPAIIATASPFTLLPTTTTTSTAGNYNTGDGGDSGGDDDDAVATRRFGGSGGSDNEQIDDPFSPPAGSRLCPARMTVGHMSLQVGKTLVPMTEHTHLLKDPKVMTEGGRALRKVLESEGYLLFRGVLPRSKVAASRLVVLETMNKEFPRLLSVGATSKPLIEAHIANKQKGVLLTGFQTITKHPHVLGVLESDELAQLMSRLFDSSPATFDNKWVRVHGFNEFTDEHTDYYRFSGTAQQMVTCWIPHGDYHPTHGTLAVCSGSHALPGYTLTAYGNETKIELPPDYNKIKHSAIWKTTEFKMGDVVIFDIRTIHASTANTTERFRISMDTRWQPGECVPVEAACMYRHFPYWPPAPSVHTTTATATATASVGSGIVIEPSIAPPAVMTQPLQPATATATTAAPPPMGTFSPSTSA